MPRMSAALLLMSIALPAWADEPVRFRPLKPWYETVGPLNNSPVPGVPLAEYTTDVTQTRAYKLHVSATRHYDHGRYADAIADLTLALVADSKDPTIWHSRGSVWLVKNEFEEAIKDYTKAHELDPKSVSHLCARGNVRYARGEYEDAIADYTKAHEINTSHPLPLLARGKAKYALKEFDKAVEDFDEVIAVHPMSDRAYLWRGTAWYEQQEYGKAVADFTKVLGFYPKDVDALCWRAKARCGDDDYEKAIADYEKVIEFDPKHACALCDLAQLRSYCREAKYRDAKKALGYAKKLVELNPKEWYYRQTLAVALAEAGDFEEAMNQQEKVLSDDTLTEEERHHAEWAYQMYEQKKPLSGQW